MIPFLILAALAAASPVQKRAQRTWGLFQTTIGEDFYRDFDFVTFDDPTRGKTNYVDQQTAQSRGLAWTQGSQFGMTCDTSSIVPPDARGRDSVRIHSKGWFGEVLVVADIAHMPSGCGTWPAFWTNGYGPWPAGGEFDIIEGTNGGGKNRVTLHTQNNMCEIPKTKVPGMSDFSGQVRRNNCTYGAGCSIEDQNAKAWAAPFNANGGGWYVMRRNRGGYAVWFFERNSNVPEAIKNGLSTVDEDALGTKVADFPFWDNLAGAGGATCNFQDQFTDHQLIFNIAMGGHWAEGNYKNFGCEGDIYDLILNQPDKLKEAYWIINSLRIYGPDGDAAITPGAGAAQPSSSAAASPTPAESSSTPAPTPEKPTDSPSSSSSSTPAPAETPATPASSSTPAPEPTPEQPEKPTESTQDAPESTAAVPDPQPEPAPPKVEQPVDEQEPAEDEEPAEEEDNDGNDRDGGRGGRGRGRGGRGGWRGHGRDGSWRGHWRAASFTPGDSDE